MPQYIEIAVVSSDIEALRAITKDSPISQPGIAPKYHLVALHKPSGKRVIGLSELDNIRVLFWVALDEQAKIVCEEFHRRNTNNKQYSRGFYGDLLPEPVILVKSSTEFKEVVHKVYKAFCASS